MSKRTASADVFEQVQDTETDAAELTDSSVDAEVAEADAAAGATESAAAASKRRVGLAALVCALLFTVLVAALGFLGWRQYEQYRVNAASDAGLLAAKDYAVVLTTLDAKNIDENYRKSLDGATGEFKDAYSKAAATMRKMLIDNKVSTTGVVEDSAVKDVRGDDVDVLLSVKQDVTSAGVKEKRTDYVSVSMTMRKVGDRWLAAEVLLAGADGKRGK